MTSDKPAVVCCDCDAELPDGEGGVYRRARSAGWSRRYRRTGAKSSDFACPDCRLDRDAVGR